MEDLELFKKKVTSYIDKAYAGGVSLLNFLDDTKMGILEEKIKREAVNVYYYGGIINSDRSRAIISSFEPDEDDFKIKVFKVIYNKKYYSINHRSILGSLMSLGIKRECIGDIVINDSLDAYFACTKEISNYLLDNFKYIGSANIEIELVEEKIENIIKYEDKLHFLSSMRLDVIIAGAYNLSRSEAQEIITNGLVFVNYINILNHSHLIKLDDIISVRHKGKFKVSNIGGQTKSNRLAVTISKRV